MSLLYFNSNSFLKQIFQLNDPQITNNLKVNITTTVQYYTHTHTEYTPLKKAKKEIK